MRAPGWLIGPIFAFLFAGCVSTYTAPSPETRRALAPTGPLRVAFLSGPLYATQDAATGELKGVAIDLGKELGMRLGVPFQPVPYTNPAAIIAAGKAGDWDVALMGINAERAASVNFSSPYMEVEQGYLVRAGVPVAAASEMDRPGIRIAVIENTGADRHLSGRLKHATLVRARNPAELETLFENGKADVVAATKSFLIDSAAKRPGSRVLDERLLVEPIGMGVPKGRGAVAADYIRRYVEYAKAKGLVKSAIDRAGLRGVSVAAPAAP